MKVKKEGLQIKLELTREDYYSSVKRMLNILIPDIEVVNDDSAEVVITSNLKVDTDKIKLKTKLVSSDTELMKKDIDTEIRDARYTDGDIERRCRSKVKFHIYQLLVKFLDLTPSPWGILIGVRPTKIGHFLMDKGFDYNEIKNNLQSTYGVSNEKADLLLRIVKKERIYLPTKEEVKDRVSIYIGIPFCPSRCGYCSFPAYGLKDAAKYISPFLKSLHYEIREVGSWLAKNGITVDTIYLGGGTPTTLNEEQLKELLAIIKES
ncbi:MAG: coproporphyrinogen dehydrogenase HemZ, partial [Candidatus Frackibacter sp. T328-2]